MKIAPQESKFKIENYEIGGESPAFIIAEVGINHNGDLDLALDLIDAAAECGVNAVKFQTFKAEKLVRKSSEYLDIISKTELKPDEFKKLADRARQRDLVFLSTPFDEESADMLDLLGMPAFKIASGDITYIPLIRHIARKNKPMLISTGASGIGEIDEAVRAAREENPEISLCLLHCISHYPAKPHEVNLRVIKTMKKQFGVPIGYSDHTIGIIVPQIAVALGADLIEKHFTMDKNLEGPDHLLSCDPKEMESLVQYIRITEESLGSPSKRAVETEETKIAIRRSITAKVTMKEGSAIMLKNIVCKRPATGIAPKYIGILTGRKVRHEIKEEDSIDWDDI